MLCCNGVFFRVWWVWGCWCLWFILWWGILVGWWRMLRIRLLGCGVWLGWVWWWCCFCWGFLISWLRMWLSGCFIRGLRFMGGRRWWGMCCWLGGRGSWVRSCCWVGRRRGSNEGKEKGSVVIFGVIFVYFFLCLYILEFLFGGDMRGWWWEDWIGLEFIDMGGYFLIVFFIIYYLVMKWDV